MQLPTIHSLRKAGYKVKIDHYRHVLFAGERLDCKLAKGANRPIMPQLHTCQVTRKDKKERRFDYIHPKGGTTRVFITSPSGHLGGVATLEGFATADCNAKDRFNRRLGLRICLSRLVTKEVIPASLPIPSTVPSHA